MKEFTILDGGMGTMLQKQGLAPGEHPERMSMEQPAVVTEIHRAYHAAGAEIVYANTFGANARKLAGSGMSVADAVTAGIHAAKAAGGARVALDIGPTGALLAPMGELTFGEAYDMFAEMVRAGVTAGADLIAIETMSDPYEVKAAVLAAKENSTLPILVTMTFEAGGRTFTGCPVAALGVMLDGMGVQAVGVNCSMGPEGLYPIVEELARWTSLPLIVKANAGMPHPETGAYDIGPDQFAEQMARFPGLGVTYLGGCCGTEPAHIQALSEKLAGLSPAARAATPPAALCTATEAVLLSDIHVVGARMDVAGVDADDLIDLAYDRMDEGAELLVLAADGADADGFASAGCALQAAVRLPLVLDAAAPAVLDAGLRAVSGRAMAGPVADMAQLEASLPVAAKYGAAVWVDSALDRETVRTLADACGVRDVVTDSGMDGASERTFVRI